MTQRSGARRSAPPAAADNLARIWRAVAAIPRGSVATYGSIAARAGLARRARLVGHALKVAPDELRLPWHRVVAAGGLIAFPAGSRLYREQRRRLQAEGVQVLRGRVQRPAELDLGALLWGRDRC
jgi:methylated-DNA-protein-cysteine methyltransferase-like protein